MEIMQCFDEFKVMRDPIHAYIHVDIPIIWELINTKEFQRLRRIHQLGGAYLVFHTSEHSRFGHSLGVYEIVRRMLIEITDLNKQLNEHEKLTVLIAALLHDIGHGPYSHTFESVCPINHETMSVRILMEDSEVNRVLTRYDSRLPAQVSSVINHTHPNRLLSQLITSQLDADRMDYLLRDSYFTGTKYGEYDLERILRTLRVIDDRLVIKENGIHAIEDYIMARYHMYWQVYYHATARSFEAILVLLLRRLLEIGDKQRYPMFTGLFAGKDITIEQHFKMDEYTCFYGFSLMSEDDDPILKDLAERIINRRLFAYISVPATAKQTDYHSFTKGRDPRYYLYLDSASQIPYRPYLAEVDDLIMVLAKDQKIVELSKISNIVLAIAKGEIKEDYKLFYPE